ncbi:MAG TPA: glutathione S-transferase N-terminal domain-containing protein [Hyphomicrobiales bacterium]|nr:glutathione S-transferase N-terminal domain-containing protein [Hyphomicrobiales bacterium]
MQTKPAQPIRVYNSPFSGHCHRVRLLLSLLDLPHEVIDVDLRGGENKQPAFLARNPLGQVPVIEDGDVTIYDSNAILIYLALSYDDGTWMPRQPVAAATVQRWLGLAAGPIYYGPNLARLAALFKAPVDHAQAQAVATRLLDAMERELTGKDFALGSRPSLADVAAYAYVARAPEGGVALEPYHNVRGWLARVEALPRFVPMMAVGGR